VPPHQLRAVNLTVITGCGTPGTVAMVHELTLRVHSDGGTWSEHIELPEYLAVSYRAANDLGDL